MSASAPAAPPAAAPGAAQQAPPADEAAPVVSLRLVLDTVRAVALDLHPQSLRVNALGADDSLTRDYGLDSLARVELMARLERDCRLHLPESAFSEPDTPAQLLVAIRAAAGLPRADAEEDDALAPAQAARAELPDTVPTLIAALQWHVAVHPERLHLVLHDEQGALQTLTYQRLRELALAVAGGLIRDCGVRSGDRVAIMLPTGIDFFAAFHGALHAGAVPVPIYPPARASQMEDHLRRVAGIVANAGARVLVTVAQARPMLALLRPLAPALREITEVASLRRGPPLAAPVTREPADIALLQYTSGSTGQPKGVVLSHANLMANLRGMRTACAAHSGDVFVSWLPLYHDMGLIGAALGSMVFGFRLALCSPFAFLGRPSAWLWLLHRHRATITAGPNFAYELCVSKVRDDELQGLDLSCVRLMFNGAEAVSADTVERLSERLRPWGLRPETMTPVYGLAECALGLTFPPLARGPLIERIERGALLERGLARPAGAGARAPIRLVSSGRVLPGHEVRIVGAGEAVLGEREQGEIEFRGPSATHGYFGNPEATRRLVHGGWLRSGDLGYLAQAELFVTGRTRDIIIRGGHNIHPQELEAAAAEVRGVRKGGVAVFPARDPGHGTERLIVLAETLETDPHERERIVTEIGHLAVDLIGLPADEVMLAPPRSVLKTSSGKIRRSACRERFEAGELGRPVRAPWQQVLRLAGVGAGAWLGRARRAVLGAAFGAWAALCFLPVALATAAVVLARTDLPARRRAAQRGARALFALWRTPPQVSGTLGGAHAPACLIVTNHASYLDGLVLTAALAPSIAFVVKRELAASPLVGAVLRGLGAVFVERFDPSRSAADAGRITDALREQDRLVVFAEGTLQREPGLLPLHMGAFLAAAAQGAAVVPVAILGTRDMLPDGRWLPRRAGLRVVVGPPIAPSGTGWAAAVAQRAQVRAWLLAQTGEPDLDR
jgi:1-acyl-sn-glycerol-3-phosphate acyltransferase